MWEGQYKHLVFGHDRSHPGPSRAAARAGMRAVMPEYSGSTVYLSFPGKVSINFNGNALSTVNEHRHLGLILSSDLRWSAHIDKILSKQDAYSTQSYVCDACSL